MRPLKFRHRIGALVVLAATALFAVSVVTLVLGRRSERELSGIETRYVPLVELDRDLKRTSAELAKALEDAAAAAEDPKLGEADRLRASFLRRLSEGAAAIVDNGGDPSALARAFLDYYAIAREVAAALVAGTPAAQLDTQIEAMRRSQLAFATLLDATTAPDRTRMSAAFAAARASQDASLRIDILVACGAFLLMAVISWRIIRRTVRSLQAVSDGVERLARGDFAHEIDVPPGDEIGDLAREANRTATRLREYRDQGEREAWIKHGLTELAIEIAGELDATALGHKAMRYLERYTAAEAVIMYARDDDGRFHLLEPAGALRLADAELAGAVVDDQVREHAKVAVVPLTHEGRVMGVLGLATPGAPHDRVIALLERSRGTVAVALRVAESQQRAHGLLAETQRQATAAETANKELEAFSYSVSHDLRAPLRGIDGFSQALVEDEADRLSPEGHEHLRRIRAGAQRMAELIDDLLRLARVSRAELRRERVDLSALAATIVAELRRGAPDRAAVDVIVRDGVTARADPRLIRITLENLLGNAWKFTAKTAAPVIEFGARDDAGQLVYFVRDNGAGFDMQYVDRLFGAFQRLHSDKEFPGTGIGLATVQRIVVRHGGRIWVEAGVGTGATFRFTLA